MCDYDDEDRPRRPVRAICGECGGTGDRHVQGCPETPDDPPEADIAFDELELVDQCDALAALPHDRLLAECEMALADARMWHATATYEQLRNERLTRERDALLHEVANLRANALRWLHVSRRGPMAMQVYDERTGVITLRDQDADNAVDAAIAADEATRIARDYPMGITA